jgi:hypothetical protein
VVEGTGFSVGSLGIGASIIVMVGALLTEGLIFGGLMEGNAWMSEGFEGLLAIGTLDRVLFNEFMTVGATRHGIWVLLMIFESKLI